MKKTTFILLILLAAGNAIFAQLSAVDYKSKDYEQFKASKTYFVKTGNAQFDNTVIDAMKDVWKITPYDVIESKELDTKIPDKSASFLISIIIGTQYPQQNYHYLALINGGEKKLSKYGYNDMLAYCPINHWVDEKENTDCAYRVRNMVESMAQTMDIVQKNDIHGNPKKIAEGLEEQYNAKSPKIKKRTLLFCEESIGNKLTKDEVKGLYPYKMEVCSKAKLAEAIKDKSKDYYYLQLASTLNHFVFVIDPSNGEVMYGHFKTQGMAIKKDDLKDLLEAIDK